ncbi:MAG: hypothetical protein LCH26_01775 [Proteobacteria bacterium]|nr:hypothetical protein [Pseudomonadota bacterium]
MMKTLHLTLLCLLTCTAAKASFVEEVSTSSTTAAVTNASSQLNLEAIQQQGEDEPATSRQKSARLWEQYLTGTSDNLPEIRSAATLYQEANQRAQDLAQQQAQANIRDAHINKFELR